MLLMIKIQKLFYSYKIVIENLFLKKFGNLLMQIKIGEINIE